MKKLIFLLFLFLPINVFALTNTGDIQEINVTYYREGQSNLAYTNISKFLYDGFYYSDQKYNNTDDYALGANVFFFTQTPAYATSDVNYYFNSPCGNDDINYSIITRFYYREGTKINFNNVPIIYGNSGCTGTWVQLGDDYDLITTCNLRSSQYVPVSFYFNQLPLTRNSFSSYRIGIQKGFQYTCSISTQAVIENNNINSQREINAINDTNKSINDLNEDIVNDDIDSNNASSSASEWDSKNATNGTITSLLTLPITLLQAIVNGLQTSCSSFSLGSLFGTNINLPCINVGELIGTGLWTTIDFLFSGFMILAIAKKLIKIFNDFTNLKSNQIDELYGGDNK